MNEAQAIRLSRVPGIAGVYENAMGELTWVAPANSWGRDRVDETDLTLDGLYNYYYTGMNVVAHIIDSGVNPVGDIPAHRLIQRLDYTGTGLDDCYPGGHGTQVASTIGGSTFGIAGDVSFVSLKVANCEGGGTEGDVIAAINWVITNKAPLSVINISLAYNPHEGIDAAVRDAVDSGIVVVVGAGNNRGDACLRSPARAGNPNYISNNPNQLSAITVAASDWNDRVSWWSSTSWSNTGECVDLFAPGGPGLRATGNTGAVDENWRGTSAAAPHVAGMAALSLEKIGAAYPGMVESNLVHYATPNKIQSNLQTSPPAIMLEGTPNLLLYHVTTTPKRRSCCL
jgi:serine protease